MQTSYPSNRPTSLCEALDRVLAKGAVAQADIIISVADVDLLYIDLRAFLASVETALRENAVPADFQTKERP